MWLQILFVLISTLVAENVRIYSNGADLYISHKNRVSGAFQIKLVRNPMDATLFEGTQIINSDKGVLPVVENLDYEYALGFDRIERELKIWPADMKYKVKFDIQFYPGSKVFTLNHPRLKNACVINKDRKILMVENCKSVPDIYKQFCLEPSYDEGLCRKKNHKNMKQVVIKKIKI